MHFQRPTLGYTLLIVAIVSLCLWLGFWQLDREQQKIDLIESYRQRSTEPTIPLSQLGQNWRTEQYRRFKLDGGFIDVSILLENQIQAGQVGFHHYQILKTKEGHYVLINLGWQANKAALVRALPQGTFEAILRAPPEVGIRLGSLDQTPFSQPMHVPYLDITWLDKRLGLQLEPYVLVRIDPNVSITSLLPKFRITPKIHRGYAITWFSLAVAMLVLFGYSLLRIASTAEENQ